jgi:hypothetical protein
MNTKGTPFKHEPESTPQRMHVPVTWEFGVCKRCLGNGVKAGDVIVRIYGRGWWHDACYRIRRRRLVLAITHRTV